jgi:16S rRNA processing protein RimM
MRIDDCFELGHIIKPHGLSGEVWMLIDADFPEAYQQLESVFLEQKGELIPFFVESISIHGNKALTAFEEVEDVDQATALIGLKAWLPLSMLPPLKEGQFYFHEVIDFEVEDSLMGPIGKIKEINSASAQDILVIAHPTGPEILIPLADDILRGVDRATRRLHIQAPEGLIQLYLDEHEN